MTARLRVENLSKHFFLERKEKWWGRKARPITVRAVQGVTFTVQEGQVLAIVGESGCGKTTVARMLVGLEQPSGGTLSVDGHQLSGQRSQADRRLIQLVSQNPWSALNRRRSVMHALAQPLTVHEPTLTAAARHRRVGAMAERVGLPLVHLGKRPGALSGGELARAVLARALLARPKVIVLDEPTASLDASVKATVVNLLLDLRTEMGLCMVVITHELPIARRLADKVAVMYFGRFAETGAAQEVLRMPVHPYSRMLLASVPSPVPGTPIPELGIGEVPSAVAPPIGCSYHPRCAYRGEVCTTSVPQLTLHRNSSVACHRAAYLDE